jgi:hypothetical protein
MEKDVIFLQDGVGLVLQDKNQVVPLLQYNMLFQCMKINSNKNISKVNIDIYL